MMPKVASPKTQIRPRLRIQAGRDIALGPGKVELLEAVDQTGSITQAARKMGMSYMRAWTLIRTMNRCFREPVVAAVRGGRKGGGGAALTPSGRSAVALFQSMTKRSLKAIEADWRKLQKLLRS